MAGRTGLRHEVDRLKQRVRRLARAAAPGASNGVANVKIDGRRNIQVAANVGEPGSTTVASANQHAPIEQRGQDASS